MTTSRLPRALRGGIGARQPRFPLPRAPLRSGPFAGAAMRRRALCSARASPRLCPRSLCRIASLLPDPAPSRTEPGRPFTAKSGHPAAVGRRPPRRRLSSAAAAAPNRSQPSDLNRTVQIRLDPSQLVRKTVNRVLFANKPLCFIKINPPSYAVEKYLQNSPCFYDLTPEYKV